jgi:hypothetical protein
MRINPSVSLFVFGPLLTLLVGCGGDDGSMGATASLSWDPGNTEPGVAYTVHYGKNPTGEFGSCNYEHAVDVTDPFITIADLDFSTHYYFAVSAYDTNTGLRRMCSDEVSKLTPEQELRIGDPKVTPERDLYIGDPPIKL